MIPIECDQCHRKFRAPENAIGKQVKCPCGTSITVAQNKSASEAKVAHGKQQSLDAASAPTYYSHPCECGRRLRIAQSVQAKKAKCPCGLVFVIPSQTAPVSKPVSAVQTAPAAKPLSVSPSHVAMPLPVAPITPTMRADPFGSPSIPPSSGITAGTQNPGGDWLSYIPPATPYVPAPSSPAPNPYQSDAYSPGQDYLAAAIKEKRRKQVERSDDDSSNFFNSTVIGGIIMMGIATVWFAVGLANDIIFFYPPVMFILGIVGVIKGLLGADD